MWYLPSALSSLFSLPHIGTRAQHIPASCQLSDTSLVCTPGTCDAYTCRSRNRCHTCTDIQRSWWCFVWRSPCSPRMWGHYNDNQTHDRHIQGTILLVVEVWVLFFSSRHILRHYHFQHRCLHLRCHHHRYRHLRCRHLPRNYFHSHLLNPVEIVRPSLELKYKFLHYSDRNLVVFN